MILKTFFDAIRGSALYPKGLADENVFGIEAILNACDKWNVTDTHHVAQILAQSYQETGGFMQPVKETVYAHSPDKNPSDATVIARLDNAYRNNQLPWVTKPYWREGWFGRGFIQITHKENYVIVGEQIGVDLVANRALALNLSIAADIAVVGMSRGLFTGMKLSDYKFPECLDTDEWRKHPRRIVNGKDGTDATVAKNHKLFYNALVKAGHTSPKPVATARTKAVIIGEIEKLLAELKTTGE